MDSPLILGSGYIGKLEVGLHGRHRNQCLSEVQSMIGRNGQTLSFPTSGEYVVPGALALVSIDRENNVGYHEEPNVWIIHDV